MQTARIVTLLGSLLSIVVAMSVTPAAAAQLSGPAMVGVMTRR